MSLYRSLIVTVLAQLLLSLPGAGQSPVGLPLQAPPSNINPIFTHINVKDGLPDRIIYSMVQDQEGFIWMATNLGLVRWDGHDFQQFNRHTGNLPFDRVKAIALDHEGKLWLNPVDAQNRRLFGAWLIFDSQTGQYRSLKEQYPSFTTLTQWEDFNYFSLSEEEDLFLGVGLQVFSRNAQRIVRKEEEVWDAYYSEDGVLWLVRASGEGKFQLSKAGLKQGGGGKWILPDGIAFSPQRLNNFFVDQQGRHWCRKRTNETVEIGYFIPVSGDSVLAWHPAIWLPETAQLISTNFNHYNQTIWLLFDGRLSVWKIDQGWIYDVSGLEFPEALSRQERIWFLERQPESACFTGGEGLIQVRLKEIEFQSYFDDSPGVFSARAITADERGNILANGAPKLEIVDPKTGSPIALGDYFPGLQPLLRQYRADLLGGYVAFRDKRGVIWAELDGQLIPVNRYPNIRPVNDWSTYKTGLAHTYVFYENPFDSAYCIWAVGNSYLGRLYPDESKVEDFDRLNAFQEAYMGAEKHAAYPEDKGHFWICSRKGLFLCHVDKGLVEHYSTEGKGRFYLPHDIISHMHKDSDGIYWLSSKGGGLIRWNRQTGEWKQYTVAEGLSNNVLYAVYEDGHGNLWLPSNYGLMSFNKATEKVQLFLPEDGIAHEEFNTWSHYRGADGALCFGGLNGITVFHPDSLGFQAPLANVPLLLTQVSIEDKKTGKFSDKTAMFRQGNSIQVSPADRSVFVQASLMDFYKTSQHLYGFKIEGFDKEWNYQKSPQYRITNLPYGHYRLQVRAKSAEGKWAAEELSIPLDFLRPFYAKTWFILLCILAIAGLIAFLFIYRIRALKSRQLWLEQEVRNRTQTIQEQSEHLQEQAEQLKELDQAKSRFFTNVSHELRTPLTLILGPIGALLKTKEKVSKDYEILKTVQQNSKKLLGLVNEILDLSKLESGKMEVEESPTHLYDFMYRILEDFGPASRQKQLRLSFHYDLRQEALFLLDAPKVEVIVSNLLSNAMRFTPPQGSLSVTVSSEGPSLNIRVTDTGRGIPQEDQPHIFNRYFQSTKAGAPVEGGAGIGLALSRELAELLKGRLTVESQVGKGSIFQLELPRKEAFGEQPIDSRLEKTRKEPGMLFTKAGEESAPAEGMASRPAESKATSGYEAKPHVLVVEDHYELQLFLRDLLESRYTVSLASNGREALGILEKKGPAISLILSDIMMPEMDGYALLEALKSSDTWRAIPVIMLTARVGKEDKLRALRLGVDDYLAKPFEAEELLARIGALLSRRQERQKACLEEARLAGQPTGSPLETLLSEPADNLPPFSSQDQQWLEELETITFSRIGDFNLNTESLAYDLSMSGRSLQRRLKSLTGLTPNEYLQEARLQKARELLESRECSSVKEATLSVGMRDIPYFSRLFKKRFGKVPSELL